MKIKSTALSLTVVNVTASSNFLKDHFGFKENWSGEGFAYLTHERINTPIIFLKTGNEMLSESIRNQIVSGIIVAFVVEDIEVELTRLKSEGVIITAPLQEDPWGERLFQVMDPNGVVIQLVQWVEPTDERYVDNNPGSKVF